MATVTDRDFREWQMRSESGETLIWLMSITHPTLAEGIYVSSDMTEFIGLHPELKEPMYGTRHKGRVYYAVGFALTVPDQPESGDAMKASVRIDNVQQEHIAAIRDMESAALFEVFAVFASSPDVVRQKLPLLRITTVSYDASGISAELGPDDFRMQTCPRLTFLPSVTPGLF